MSSENTALTLKQHQHLPNLALNSDVAVALSFNGFQILCRGLETAERGRTRIPMEAFAIEDSHIWNPFLLGPSVSQSA